jgi:hypothetical protein
MEIDRHFNEVITEQKRKQGEQETTARSIEQPSSSLNGWRSDVPNDWVEVIEQDLILQQQNQSQNETSYSDAYLSGLPAKKRRILISTHDLARENLFKKVLDRTLNQVTLKPNWNQDQLIEERFNQSELLNNFDTEFDSAITQRLRSDAAFLSIVNDQKEEENENEYDDVLYNKNRYSLSKKRLN